MTKTSLSPFTAADLSWPSTRRFTSAIFSGVTAYRPSDLLVGFAANDQLEDFPLAWRQSPETGAHAFQFVLQIA